MTKLPGVPTVDGRIGSLLAGSRRASDAVPSSRAELRGRSHSSAVTVRDLLPAVLALTASLALAAGCDMPEPGDDREEQGAVFMRPGGGGIWLNTSAIDSHAFAALDLKKNSHDGVRLDRVLVKQGANKFVVVDRVKGVDGEIHAGRGTTNFSGQQLVGSKWELTLLVNGTETPATMWISGATNNQGVWQYTFQHHDALGNVANLCETDAHGKAVAVPIADMTVNASTGDLTSRNNTLYLACTSGALGKAVTWGYSPWDIGMDEFEATIRVVRADYCGDGQSWTTPGTGLQIEDAWGVSGFAVPTATNEAVWGASGALCIATTRVIGQGAITCDGVVVPTCAANVSLTNPAGALLWTKNAPM